MLQDTITKADDRILNTEADDGFLNTSNEVLKVLTISFSTLALICCIKTKNTIPYLSDVALSHLLIGVFSIQNTPLRMSGDYGRTHLIMNRSIMDCVAVTAVSLSTTLFVIVTIYSSVDVYCRAIKWRPFHNIQLLRSGLWFIVLIMGPIFYIAQEAFSYFGADGLIAIFMHIAYIIPFIVLLKNSIYPFLYERYKNTDVKSLCVRPVATSWTLWCCLIVAMLFLISYFPVASFQIKLLVFKAWMYTICYSFEGIYIKCLLFGYVNSLLTPLFIIYVTTKS